MRPYYDEDDWVPPPPRHRGVWLVMGRPFVSETINLPFKPYVYNGTGEDQFPETDEKPEPPPPPAPTVEEYRERERAREVARMKRLSRKRKAEQWKREAAARRRERKMSRVTTVRTVLDPPDPWLDRLVLFPEVDHEEDPPPVLVRRQVIRPSPGWKPMTGADIDELLTEIGE